MLTVSKKKDSVSGEEFSCVRLTENQLHQLAMLKRGESLFDCVVMHAGYSENDHGPVRNKQTFKLVFSYQGVCYGRLQNVSIDELPWKGKSDTDWRDVEEVAYEPGPLKVETYTKNYLIRVHL